MFEAFTAATVIYIVVNLIVVNPDALAREAASRCPASSGRQVAGEATDDGRLSTSTSSSARCGYLFREGMTFTLTLTGAGGDRRHRLRHAARDDAAVVAQVAAAARRPATST